MTLGSFAMPAIIVVSLKNKNPPRAAG